MTMVHRTGTSFLQKLSVGVILWALSISSLSESGSLCLAFRPNPSAVSTTRISTRIAHLQKSRDLVLASSPNDIDEEEEDDGWGTTASSSTTETDRKLNELRSLREEASNKAQAVTPSSSSSTSSFEEPPERDMFIPIMAVVSLLGLFGAYGYETLRLASRGELYLPF